jgi:hypothetical protein
MANWKKVIVSGSAAELLNVTASAANITTLNVTAGSGSFSGSFQGDGSGLTNVPASGIVLSVLSQSLGIENFSYDGQASAVVQLATGSDHFISGSRKTISVADTTGASGIDLTYDQGTGVLSGSLVNSSIILGSTTASLGSTVTTLNELTLTAVSATGSFTGSFVGDGSGLTGLATTLSGSTDSGNFEVNLLTQTLTVQGTTNEIETSATGQTITIGLPNDVTINQDLIVNRNLTVIGTASFQSTTNLEVADRFVLFASGSNEAGDGGIVVQQGTQDVGELFGYDASVNSNLGRWGLTGSFNASSGTFTPDAFMAAAVIGAGTDPTAAPARYQVGGNLFIGTDENIWIYS